MDVDIFIDWITIKQNHPDCDLPQVRSGFFVSLDRDWRPGQPIDMHSEYQLTKSHVHQGSYDTRILVRCDGSEVYVSGNVGAFGRPDNVFGYDLDTVVSICNQILEEFGLPSFTVGEEYMMEVRHKDGSSHNELRYTGAILTRLDVTANYALGSEDDSARFLAFLSSQ